MASDTYDVVVIGGGPGGYVCAIKAAQLGLKAACIDRRPTLGGTCLNVGCIPSKALLHATRLFEQAKEELGRYGIRVGEVTVELDALMARKERTVAELTRGIAFLFRKNRVDHLCGEARLLAPDRVQWTPEGDEPRTLTARHVVVASGSRPSELPGIAIDEERVLSSTGALALTRVPEHLVVIGAGYIGLELGTVWRRLGARVTVVEYLDRIAPGLDGELAAQLEKALAKQGLRFHLGRKVVAVEHREDGVEVVTEARAGGEEERIAADRVLVAVGRRPNSEGFGLEELGVARDAAGRIEVDDGFRTNLPGLYAIGDVVRGPMLAHKAEEEGVALAERIAGGKPHVNYEVIPAVIFTHPEAASVGRTEEELKEAGIPYRVGRFPMSANARARTTGEVEGFVKLLADAATDRLLGAHILGPEAGVLIQEIAVAMEFGASSEDIARTCHPHPTLEEAVKEAALAAFQKPLHV